MICPRCKVDLPNGVESCPECVGKESYPHKFDIHLFPFKSAKATNDVGRYLLSISKDKNPERIKSLFANLPKIVFKGMSEKKAILMSQKLKEIGADARVIRSGKVRPKKVESQVQKAEERPIEVPRLNIPIVKADEPPPPTSIKGVASALLAIAVIAICGWAFFGYIEGQFDGAVAEIENPNKVVKIENKKVVAKSKKPSEERPARKEGNPKNIQLTMDDKYREEIEKLISASTISGDRSESEENEKDETEKKAKSNLLDKHIKFGWDKYKKKEYDLALDAFNTSLEEKPSAKGYEGRGFVYSARGDNISAMEAFEKSLSMDNDSELVHFMFAALLYDDNSLEDAKEHFEEVLRLNPQNALSSRYLSKIKREFVEESFNEKESFHFNVKYEGAENGEVGHVVSLVLEEAYEKVGRDLNFRPKSAITAILYTNEQYRDITQSPSWSGGLYDGKIRLPVGGLNSRTSDLARVIYHEYTHAIIHRIAKGNCPTWLNEGLAQYEEGDKAKKRAIAVLKRDKKLISLKSLEGSFLNFPPNVVPVAYGVSLLAVDYIVKEYGVANLKRLLETLGEGEKGEKALSSVLYISYEEIEKGILRELEKS